MNAFVRMRKFINENKKVKDSLLSLTIITFFAATITVIVIITKA